MFLYLDFYNLSMIFNKQLYSHYNASNIMVKSRAIKPWLSAFLRVEQKVDLCGTWTCNLQLGTLTLNHLSQETHPAGTVANSSLITLLFNQMLLPWWVTAWWFCVWPGACKLCFTGQISNYTPRKSANCIVFESKKNSKPLKSSVVFLPVLIVFTWLHSLDC